MLSCSSCNSFRCIICWKQFDPRPFPGSCKRGKSCWMRQWAVSQENCGRIVNVIAYFTGRSSQVIHMEIDHCSISILAKKLFQSDTVVGIGFILKLSNDHTQAAVKCEFLPQSMHEIASTYTDINSPLFEPRWSRHKSLHFVNLSHWSYHLNEQENLECGVVCLQKREQELHQLAICSWCLEQYQRCV